MRWGLGLAIAAALIGAEAAAAVPAHPRASAAEINEAKRLLEASGYRDVTVLSSDDQIVTASAVKDGTKSVLDVDPMTKIVLPHADMPPIPPRLAPVTDLPASPR
jgi:hypothetical protein